MISSDTCTRSTVIFITRGICGRTIGNTICPATRAELSGAPVSHQNDGISALPAILGGGSQAQHDFLCREKGLRMQAVRMGDWKCLHYGGDRPGELYDLVTDTGETLNFTAQHQDAVRTIQEYLKTARVAPREYEPEPPTYGYKAEETGYVR